MPYEIVYPAGELQHPESKKSASEIKGIEKYVQQILPYPKVWNFHDLLERYPENNCIYLYLVGDICFIDQPEFVDDHSEKLEKGEGNFMYEMGEIIKVYTNMLSEIKPEKIGGDAKRNLKSSVVFTGREYMQKLRLIPESKPSECYWLCVPERTSEYDAL